MRWQLLCCWTKTLFCFSMCMYLVAVTFPAWVQGFLPCAASLELHFLTLGSHTRTVATTPVSISWNRALWPPKEHRQGKDLKPGILTPSLRLYLLDNTAMYTFLHLIMHNEVRAGERSCLRADLDPRGPDHLQDNTHPAVLLG